MMFKSQRKPKTEDIPLLHYTAFRPFLFSYLKSGNAKPRSSGSNSRTAALDKSAVLSLSTDLYDELNRRQTNSRNTPKLARNESFSDRRNAARERLARLDESKFKSFIVEILKQLETRWPHIVEAYNREYGVDDYVPLPADDQPKEIAPASRRRKNSENSLSKNHSPGRSMKPTTEAAVRPRKPSHDRPSPPYESAMHFENDAKKDWYPSPPAPKALVVNNPQGSFGLPKWETDTTGESQRLLELEREVEVLINDKKDLQEIIDRLKSDMLSLMDENAKLNQADKSQKDMISVLENENTNLRLMQTKKVSYTSSLPFAQDEFERTDSKQDSNSDGLYSPTTVIDEAKTVSIISGQLVSEFETAIAELRTNAKSTRKVLVLGSMKNIVLVAKEITAQAESASDDERVLGKIDSMSDKLSNLMLATKSHANSKRPGNQESISMIEDASEKLKEDVFDLVDLCQDRPVAKSDPKKASTFAEFMKKSADDIAVSVEALLTAARTGDFGDEFFSHADEIWYCSEDIAKECTKTELDIHADVVQEFRDIQMDLDDAVQGLMKLVDQVEQAPRSNLPKQRIATHTFNIAKLVKELTSFASDEQL
ncbi:MAG: hypothetical protein SGCHY_002458 [Lobulomycetales sp.]